jgi:hypothetical protein
MQRTLSAPLSGQSIKADDFSINTTNRGKSLLEVALSYEAQADTEDIAANAGELTIVKTSLTPRLPARLPFGR